MKKYLFVLCIINMSLLVRSQSHDKLDKFFGTEYHKGYAILANGDTIVGEIALSNDYSNYGILIFRNMISKKKTNYLPQNVLLYSVDSIAFYRKIFQKSWVFMSLIKDGGLKVYVYKYFAATPYTSGTEVSFILEKPDGTYLQVLTAKTFPFKKKVGDFFIEYPELAAQIYDKSYKFEDLYLIADKYNVWLMDQGSKN
jgi:hypothetical protein